MKSAPATAPHEGAAGAGRGVKAQPTEPRGPGGAPPVVDVAAGILWRGGRFLATRRPPGKPHAGFWELPGGKLEPGESPEEALTRELGEELGVSLREARFWRVVEHAYPERGLRVRLHFFHVTKFAGEPAPREGQALAWVTPAEAPGLAFLPADAEVVREIREPAPATGAAPPALRRE